MSYTMTVNDWYRIYNGVFRRQKPHYIFTQGKWKKVRQSAVTGKFTVKDTIGPAALATAFLPKDWKI